VATILVLHPKATTFTEHVAGVFNFEQTDVRRLLRVFDQSGSVSQLAAVIGLRLFFLAC
jgi:hypothetical protein